MPHPTLEFEGRNHVLIRPGAPSKQDLQAWDAADLYLNEIASDQYSGQACLILNDNFGAIGIPLIAQAIGWVSDSRCAHEAFQLNIEANNIKHTVTKQSALDDWHSEASLAVMRLPKTLSYLKFQLHKLHEQGFKTVLLGGMMKHLPENILDLLLQYGPVNRFPFKKKATVFQLTLEKATPTPYPKTNQFSGITLSSHANVFGRDKLDIGAQFFLEHIKKLPNRQKVADLCCGSGILGLKYKQLHPESQLDCFDESNMAVASTRLSADLNNLHNVDAFWQDGMKDSQQTYDLILCNPPFHEQHTVGDHIAKRLFKDAKQHLNPTGQLIVVGNRHLKYHTTLKRYFKQVDQIAANKKFVLLSAHA